MPPAGLWCRMPSRGSSIPITAKTHAQGKSKGNSGIEEALQRGGTAKNQSPGAALGRSESRRISAPSADRGKAAPLRAHGLPALDLTLAWYAIFEHRLRCTTGGQDDRYLTLLFASMSSSEVEAYARIWRRSFPHLSLSSDSSPVSTAAAMISAVKLFPTPVGPEKCMNSGRGAVAGPPLA